MDPVTNPVHDELLTYFKYEHLPMHLRRLSQPFCELAASLVERARVEPLNAREVSVALRKLLEAKDCAVRAAL